MKKKIPFDFILDYLQPLEITIKPMFGCHAMYSAGKILLIVRKKEDHTDSNGVWIATGKEHHVSLKKELPSLISISVLSESTKDSGVRNKDLGFKNHENKILNPKSLVPNQTSWQMIPEDADDFEKSVIKICELIRNGDIRIGKIPKSRKKKRSK